MLRIAVVMIRPSCLQVHYVIRMILHSVANMRMKKATGYTPVDYFNIKLFPDELLHCVLSKSLNMTKQNGITKCFIH